MSGDTPGPVSGANDDEVEVEAVVVEQLDEDEAVTSAEEAVVDDGAVAETSVDTGTSAEPAAPIEPIESVDDTSALDEAIGRAGALEAPDGVDEPAAEPVPVPVAAAEVRRETYVPPVAAEPVPLAAAVPQTIYVQAPEPPKSRGNRGFGILVALVATVAFAALYALAGYLLFLGSGGTGDAGELTVEFLARPVFWVPVVFFFLGYILLVAIVNRGAWWCYVIFGVLVGVLVYVSYVGGALLTVEAWRFTPDEAAVFVRQRWLDPFAILAGVIARELVVWFGAWVARHGAQVEQRNREAIAEYERVLAAGPQPIR